MGNLAIDLTPASTLQECGDVEPGDAGLVVRTRTGVWRARRASSCLLEPVPGDRVLVAHDDGGTVYVLAILARDSSVASSLVFPGDTQIVAPSGRIGVSARDGIELVSPQSVGVVSNMLNVQATAAAVTIERAEYTGTWLNTCVQRIKLVATSLDAVMDRWTQQVRQSLRRVEELEQVKAGQIDYAARDTLALHGSNAIVTAKKLVKVDSEQIHIG
ncbi:MAG: DUF3540 domain-containing protein [bacterium]|jgi:hypothetical protein|nr:DUF3540 domain-containing protein [Betaproteobacteria bacterium]